ncbi:endonuclease/exonuclease/phosphatase family protein [Spirillospora sp. NBC_01491]|uniref:endonuclease/exonuclease/phosphatase family protein n=1 Tax=Spirillospora sp. NBC_01491 TaxID=2976007 RepID=UPI002E31A484|nr:endonuclease/exonuclease/phosphatase family protein [Spirillospora sp. NBC_01491]
MRTVRTSLRRGSLLLAGALPLAALAALQPATASASAPAGAAGRGGPQRPPMQLRMESYNTCGHGCLPTKEACEATIGRDCATKLEPWADRRAAKVADDIAATRADVVATQEIGNNATPAQPGVDVESFRAPLTKAMKARGYAEAPADYAGTRHPQYGYPLKSGAGRFTYYDARRFSHLDEHGKALPHDLLWLPDSTEIYGKTMTWNTLRERSTGARFVVVDMHLEFRANGATDPNGWTKNWDEVRYADARRTAEYLTRDNPATRRLPVVFAGDFNSGSKADGASAYDAFADVGFADAYELAAPQHRTGAEYASFNGGKIPMPSGEKIDHVFVKAGTPVRQWTLVPQTTAQSGEARDLLRSDHNLMHTTVLLERVTR